MTALKAATRDTWADVAERLGVTREHLYNYREGKHSPPEHIFLRLAAAERSAGIAPDAPAAAAPERSHAAARDDTVPSTAAQLAALEASISARLDKIEAALRALKSPPPSRPRRR